MKKFTTFETQLGESVVLTDKAKLSLYKKSSNSGIAVDILEEVYRRGFAIWGEQFGGTPDSFAFDRVNSFIAGGFAAQLDEDLLDEKRGLWDNIHAKRKRIKAGSGERMRKPGSEGAPTDAALKASQNEDTDPCWKGYKQIGMKTKGGRKVPNCVPVKEQSTPSVEQIAKKHDVTVASVEKAVAAGRKVEKEHTKSTKQAEKIARDHLKERPDYYEKLKKMEKTPIEEGKIKNAASKGLKAALIGSNLVAAGSAFDTDSTKTPGHAIVQTASALPGVAGWGATGVHYALKGIDKAKEYMKPGKKKMNEERLNRIAELKASLYEFLEESKKVQGYQNWPGEKKKKFFQGPKDKDGKTETQKWAERRQKEREAKKTQVDEATYQGKTVPLNKPMKGDVKKSKVYVDPDGDGKAQKVNFGDKNMSIKKDQPGRKKSYCARSGGIKGTSDKTSANYWSRKAWNCSGKTQIDELYGKGQLRQIAKSHYEKMKASGKHAHESPHAVAITRSRNLEFMAQSQKGAREMGKKKDINYPGYRNTAKVERAEQKRREAAVKEETLDELKKQTLASYIPAAARADAASAAQRAGKIGRDISNYGSPEYEKSLVKSGIRQRSIRRAAEKLAGSAKVNATEETDSEKHSKDSKKPSSRFDGSKELVANYKKDTPGQGK